MEVVKARRNCIHGRVRQKLKDHEILYPAHLCTQIPVIILSRSFHRVLTSPRPHEISMREKALFTFTAELRGRARPWNGCEEVGKQFALATVAIMEQPGFNIADSFAAGVVVQFSPTNHGPLTTQGKQGDTLRPEFRHSCSGVVRQSQQLDCLE